MKNKTFFTALTMFMPFGLFAGNGGLGAGFLYGLSAVATVIILFAIYALMRTMAAMNRLEAGGLGTVGTGNVAHAAGEDHILRATSGTGEGHAQGGGPRATMDVFDDEMDVLLNHDYDGIQELNNKLPPWWVALFWVTIVFAVVYFPYYHIFTDWSSAKEYQAEMAKAKKEVAEYQKAHGGLVTEDNVKILKDEAALAEGKKIFEKNCVACHRKDGGGLVGPNLTDKYWLHGGSIKNVFHTITNGVPEKGMIAWKQSLSPKQIQEVASYILVKLQGTTPANPKEPQGELYEPAGE